MARHKNKSDIVRLFRTWIERSDRWRRRELLRELLEAEAVKRFLSGQSCANVDTDMREEFVIDTQISVRRAFNRSRR